MCHWKMPLCVKKKKSSEAAKFAHHWRFSLYFENPEFAFHFNNLRGFHLKPKCLAVKYSNFVIFLRTSPSCGDFIIVIQRLTIRNIFCTVWFLCYLYFLLNSVSSWKEMRPIVASCCSPPRNSMSLWKKGNKKYFANFFCKCLISGFLTLRRF